MIPHPRSSAFICGFPLSVSKTGIFFHKTQCPHSIRQPITTCFPPGTRSIPQSLNLRVQRRGLYSEGIAVATGGPQADTRNSRGTILSHCVRFLRKGTPGPKHKKNTKQVWSSQNQDARAHLLQHDLAKPTPTPARPLTFQCDNATTALPGRAKCGQLRLFGSLCWSARDAEPDVAPFDAGEVSRAVASEEVLR